MSELTQMTLTDEQVFQKIEKEQKKLRFVLPSYVAKLKYQLWLVLLRETSILITLINNYDKIPEKSPSKRIIGLCIKLSFPKKWIFAVEKRLRKRIY